MVSAFKIFIALSIAILAGAAPAADFGKPDGLVIRIEGRGWGDAKPVEIAAVLYSVARLLLSRFPNRPLAPIVVTHSGKAPISLYEKNRSGEFQVLLTARGRNWGGYAYEFAHEFCHVLSNYERHPHHDSADQHQWFEEALCEVASLYTLKHLAAEWERAPPAPELAAYAPQLQRYAERFFNESHRRLAPGTTLASWYQSNRGKLTQSAYDRNANEVVANLMLPLFEENPEIWEAIGYLNLNAPGSSFKEYLQTWHDNSPDRYKDVIRYTMDSFGLL